MLKAIIFDLDGVLYLGENAIEDAVETVAALRDLGFRVFFLTNNSGKRRQEIVQKLNRLGFKADKSNTYCGSYAMTAYLIKKLTHP